MLGVFSCVTIKGERYMAVQNRKDSKGRVLKTGEYERAPNKYEYKWRDKRGKRHSIYARSLKELREKEKEITRDILDGVKPDKTKMTINDLYYKWVQLKRGLKENTLRNYQYMYMQFVEHDFGKSLIADLVKSDIRAFYNRLADELHLKISTIDNVHTVLHQVLEIGVEDNYLRNNPSDEALKELRKAHCNDSEKRRALSVAEQELFENFLKRPGPNNQWYPIFYVALWTGLRAGELVGLRWCDLDFENNSISINHTLVYYSKGQKEGGCTFTVNTPKTKAGIRTVPMLPKVKEAFLLEKQHQEELGIQCSVTIDGYTDFVFLNRYGSVQHYGTLNKALRRIIRDCNYEVLDESKGNENVTLLPPFSCHSLRHTFTTRMCEAGVNIKVMQSVLGHADSSITLDVYAEAQPEFQQEEMLNLAEYFGKRKAA